MCPTPARESAGTTSPHLRAVLPRRPLALPRGGRHRSWPRHREAPGGGARGESCRGKYPGHRHDNHRVFHPTCVTRFFGGELLITSCYTEFTSPCPALPSILAMTISLRSAYTLDHVVDAIAVEELRAHIRGMTTAPRRLDIDCGTVQAVDPVGAALLWLLCNELVRRGEPGSDWFTCRSPSARNFAVIRSATSSCMGTSCSRIPSIRPSPAIAKECRDR